MTTGTAIAAVASTQAAIAAAEAEAAKTLACKGFVRGFQHDTATVAEMRQYAGCVERLYPDPISPDSMIALKVLVVVLLLAIPTGGWLFGRDGGSVGDWFLGAFLVPLGVAASAIVIALVWAGINFVFA